MMTKTTSVHTINTRIANSMACCSIFAFVLPLLNYMKVFEFDEELIFLIPLVGLTTTLTPFIFLKLKLSDSFLKHYIAVVLSILIGSIGCFRGIGIYILFMLVPLVSCLYFDRRFTMFAVITSYIVMVISVYIKSANMYEVTKLGYNRLELYRAYIIGFSVEYIIASIFLFQIMRRAKEIMDEQHELLIERMTSDARYELVLKESNEIVFEYYPNEDRYSANRSIYNHKDEAVCIEKFYEIVKKYPEALRIYNQILNGEMSERGVEFELDMSYDRDGKQISLWYNIECFIIRDGDRIETIVGKMHDITRLKKKLNDARMHNLENMGFGVNRRNSVYNQVMSETKSFTAKEYENMAEGHRALAQILEAVKNTENPEMGINLVLTQMGNALGLNRIFVVEIDVSSGVSSISYQWNSDPENVLPSFFQTMSLKDFNETSELYNRYGYLEVNPSEGIVTSGDNNKEFLDEAVYKVILGNQLWIPLLAGNQYFGSVCFDRYDTTVYTPVEKIIMSEVVNSLISNILKINADNANKAKSDFLSTMSHEIRTPMNAIVGMTEVTLREDLPESARNNLEMVKSSAFGLLTLINDILDFSKIEAGRFEIVSEGFNPLAILSDLKVMADTRNEGKLEINFNVPKDMPKRLNGDYVRIKQVMINYVSNAIKYTDKGSVNINVSYDKIDEKHVMFLFSVKDTGIGIKEEDLAKLFRSYSQVDTRVNHHKEGTGLGLAICKQLVELMKGEVRVESEYGSGSIFSFEIPLEVLDWSRAGELDNYKYTENEQEKEIEVFVAPDTRVLIVDDTKINLTVAKSLLKPTKMQVDLALSGEKAIELIKENDYDIVFMDHFMPGMDGAETTTAIRALPDAKKNSVTIVALTADAVSGVREELISKGMDDFLTKPIIVDDLYKILNKWVSK